MDHLTTILMEFLRIDWPWIHLGSISEPGLGTRMGRPSAWPTSWAAPCSTTPPRWDASQLCPWDVETQRETSRVEGGFPLSLKGFPKNRESEGFQDVTYGFCWFIQQGFLHVFYICWSTYVSPKGFPNWNGCVLLIGNLTNIRIGNSKCCSEMRKCTLWTW